VRLGCKIVSVKKTKSSDSWSRQQKRGYHRVLSCMQYWQKSGFQVLWVMLSTADGGDSKLLAYHHQMLRQRLERQGFPDIQHFQVKTREGNGVLHVLWAWKAEDGFRSKNFFVYQSWLSKQWAEIHGAPVVWISKVGSRRRDSLQVARYCISQYVSEQSGYEYMSYSWVRTFGFPLVRCWLAFKRWRSSHYELIKRWSDFLSGKVLQTDYGGFSIDMVRSSYRSLGPLLFESLHWI
jgi:hypothetical protein